MKINYALEYIKLLKNFIKEIKIYNLIYIIFNKDNMLKDMKINNNNINLKKKLII